MALRLSQPVRRASTEAVRTVVRPVVGARVDTTRRYTDTGGSGRDSTALSAGPEQQAAAVRALYRQVLREIPAIRENFTIVEDEAFLRALVRNLFSVRRTISDPKIIDMLVFKAKQEIGEIGGQFKGRHHIGIYIRNYHDQLARQAAAQLSATLARAPGKAIAAKDSIAPVISEGTKQTMLASWRQRGLVPADLLTWAQYERWKAEENEKFAKFAVDANFFSDETLEHNAKAKSQCSIM
jgi:hypothetical protein